MTIAEDRNNDNQPNTTQLIELYKTARQETYHWNGVNMQMWMALGVVWL